MRASPPLLVAVIFGLMAWVAWMVVSTPTQADLMRYYAPELRTATINCEDGREPAISYMGETFPEVWRSAAEPSLYLLSREPAAQTLRTYRFTWTHAFRAPMVVRVFEREPGRFWLRAELLADRSGPVERRVERALSAGEVGALFGTLKRAGAMRLAPNDCVNGLDGSHWIFEGLEPGRLQFAVRFSPQSGPLRDIGRAFLALAGPDFEHRVSEIEGGPDLQIRPN